MTTFDYFYDQETKDLLSQVTKSDNHHDLTEAVTSTLYSFPPDEILDEYIEKLNIERNQLNEEIRRLENVS